ncbi:MAG: cohesin domain-containing protein [Candidatus Aminicenantaceae bacterium]
MLIVIMTLWGCVTFSRTYKLGVEAAMNKNWDEAVEFYEKAYAENPKNSVYRMALQRAKVSASLFHLYSARRFAALDQTEEALKEYEKSLSYNYSRLVADEAKIFSVGPLEEEKPEEIHIEPPVKLKVGSESIELRFRQQASLRSIFQALGKSAGINIIFDEQFRDITYSIDLTDRTFEEAVRILCLATKNFFSIIDEQTIMIVPDQPAKRNQYELTAVKTFYLSNILAADIQGILAQLLRSQFKAPVIMIDKNLNSVTIRDAPAILELAEKILRVWDKPKGEVVIDVEIMEASRIKLRQLGLDIDPLAVGIAYQNEDEGGGMSLGGLDFSRANNFQVTLPSAFFDFLESDSDTKIIAQPRLRGLDGEEITYIVGDEVPIPRTTFQPIATGGFGQQPLTSFDYKKVGIDITITPKIHLEGDVTLEVDIKIKSLGGTGYADLPIITTKEVKNVIRLKDGETSLLAGLLKDEERKTMRGIAGIKNLPIIGRLFSSTDQTIQQTEVILTITPYIIRPFKISKQDTEPIWVNLYSTPSSASAGNVRIPVNSLLDAEMNRARMLQERQQVSSQTGTNVINLNPRNFEVPQNREFRISVNLRSQEEIYNMSLNLSFDSSVLNLKQVTVGGFVRQGGMDSSFLQNIDNSSGACTIAFSSPDITKGVKGTGGIATLVFEAKGKGESQVIINSVVAIDTRGNTVIFQSQNARVVVR